MTAKDSPGKSVAAAESVEKTKAPAQAGASQQNPAPKKGKDKKIFSCHSCRRRKLKCDRFDPCGACQARGEGHMCTWEEGQRPERNHRDSLEQLPKLILKLTEEVQELKTLNTALIENIRSKSKDPTEGLDLTLLDYRPPSRGVSSGSSAGFVGWDLQGQNPDLNQWKSSLLGLLPESSLLWGLISHYISAAASLTGFIDVQQILRDIEEVEWARQGLDLASSATSLKHLDIKVSMILAAASIATIDLDPGKAQELGLANTDIDALARDLWKGSRTLISPADLDSFHPSTKPILTEEPALPPQEMKGKLSRQSGNPIATSTDISLKVVSIKILLLLAARSFAAPSEYLKLHLDVISSAIDASLDGPSDESTPILDREWRWQLWSFICLLDWTSPGIYHNSSYFIRPEMHHSPPSKAPGLPDDGAFPPAISQEHRDRLNQTRHYLEYALALAHLSRRAEDCISRPGPVSPAEAAELCSKLDALDNKLAFYQLLGSTLPDGSTFNPASIIPVDNTPTSGSVTGGNLATDKHTTQYRLSLARAPSIQNMHLSLELGLIRFKLFRHEAFHLMHAPSTTVTLRMMCIDACMDACILVLEQCFSIGNRDVPGSQSHSQSHSQIPFNSSSEKRACTGSLRRVLQPASSAALVGQVLLHAVLGADGTTLGTGMALSSGPGQATDFQNNMGTVSKGNSATEFFAFAQGGGDFDTTASAAMPHPQGAYTAATAAAGGAWGGGWTSGEKVKVLQWHITKILELLEALQGTSSLAQYKLSLHQQCM
ncbi:Fungal Zn(2)-Cys(6) binuclear cluster domain-containing protein [Penicillium ucsense]|uniref:Fungal Zn(2)-Cys(6) binuclear cluster domain-containing protein n=1 Tax=Penicillium ucsense TaxID=2839758 RepID=A0A8J8VVT8_9EURO|nr:Fungal Zn(2)-Cys(6) binuclear cluster domain-containing protein [Penicillium ucsense]KAF7729204.1 Fungal Zn(2)-Cys(6) binuclear cluster domain-containing protein [Penicillium ucsense]